MSQCEPAVPRGYCAAGRAVGPPSRATTCPAGSTRTSAEPRRTCGRSAAPRANRASRSPAGVTASVTEAPCAPRSVRVSLSMACVLGWRNALTPSTPRSAAPASAATRHQAICRSSAARRASMEEGTVESGIRFLGDCRDTRSTRSESRWLPHQRTFVHPGRYAVTPARATPSSRRPRPRHTRPIPPSHS